MSNQDRSYSNKRGNRRGKKSNRDAKRSGGDKKPDIAARVEQENRQKQKLNRDAQTTNRNQGTRTTSIADRLGDPGKGRFPFKSLSSHRRRSHLPRKKWEAPEKIEIELPELVCERCGEKIEDYTQAIGDDAAQSWWHFDCALEHLQERENPQEGEKVVYIGGGRFAIVAFPNTLNDNDFQIKTIISWENKDKRASWRTDIARKYSRT